MEQGLFDDMKQSLQEAVEYAKGDKTKGRSEVVTISDEEIEMEQVIFQKIKKLSVTNKRKAIQYVDDLLRASN